MRRRILIVNDKMQEGYRYELAAPAGRDFGILSFAGESPVLLGAIPAIQHTGKEVVRQLYKLPEHGQL